MVIKHFYSEREKGEYCTDDAGKQYESTREIRLRWEAYGPFSLYCLCPVYVLWLFILKLEVILISILRNYVFVGGREQKAIFF